MQSNYLAAAALLALLPPAIGSPAPTVQLAAAPAKAKNAATAKKADDFDISKMIELFDKIFPLSPTPCPSASPCPALPLSGFFRTALTLA